MKAANERAHPTTLGRNRRTGFLVWLCLFFLVCFVVAAAVGEALAPMDASAQNLDIGISEPSPTHWLGTDDLGRDILSRVIVGSRSALVGPAIVALGSAVLGGALGIITGFRGGWMDSIIMRWVDLMYALPGLLVLIVVAGVVGGGYAVAVLLLMLFTAPYTARIIRAATLEQRNLPYIEAAVVLGVSRWRIMRRHLMPNILPELVATTCVQYATALLTLSSVSFLGLGAPPGSADWGLMSAENRALVFQNAAALLAPAALIVLAATSMNIVGDWLYETLERRGTQR